MDAVGSRHGDANWRIKMEKKTMLENYIRAAYSFLKCKKELLNYGYKVGKVSLKGKTVDFEKV